MPRQKNLPNGAGRWSTKQRPFDDRSQARISIEAEAVLTILRLVETGDINLLSSEVLEFEVERIPDSSRKSLTQEMLKLAKEIINLDTDMEKHAHRLVQGGVKPMDALHVACASGVKADYFCSCDDQLLKKLSDMNDLKAKVVSPLELVAEVVK